MRGKHQTTCKAGKRTIALLKTITGVKTVFIGRSAGGKGLHQGRDGMIKLQLSKPGAILAVMQTSKGVQNITIVLEHDAEDQQVRESIEALMLSRC